MNTYISRSSNLEDALKESILNELKQLNYLKLDYYARKNHNTLNLLYNNNLLDDTLINHALNEIIKNQVKLDYNYLMDYKHSNLIKYADHVANTEIFAYAIKNKIFTKTQLEEMPFDGESPEMYVKLYYKDNLFEILKEKLLNPKPLPKMEHDFDEHPSCC